MLKTKDLNLRGVSVNISNNVKWTSNAFEISNIPLELRYLNSQSVQSIQKTTYDDKKGIAEKKFAESRELHATLTEPIRFVWRWNVERRRGRGWQQCAKTKKGCVEPIKRRFECLLGWLTVDFRISSENEWFLMRSNVRVDVDKQETLI